MENPPIKSEQIEQARSSISEAPEKPVESRINNNDKLDTEVEMSDDEATATKPNHAYRVSKTTALGMMDIALLTANANQLRFLITYNTNSPTYYVSLSLVIVSLVLQLSVGIALIFKRQMKNSGRDKHLGKTNNFLTAGIFLITVINVFVASFTVTESPTVRNE